MSQSEEDLLLIAILRQDPAYFLGEYLASLQNRIDLFAEVKKLCAEPSVVEELEGQVASCVHQLAEFEQECLQSYFEHVAEYDKDDEENKNDAEVAKKVENQQKRILNWSKCSFNETDVSLRFDVLVLNNITTKFALKWFCSCNCNMVVHLFCDSNELETINIALGEHWPQLESVAFLTNHKLSSITRTDTFHGLAKLVHLNICQTLLERVEAEWFRDLVSLKQLLITQNKRLKRLLPAQFGASLAQLTILNLRENNLEVIEARAFAGLYKLEDLDLAGNQLESLEKDTFDEATLEVLKRIKVEANKREISLPFLKVKK